MRGVSRAPRIKICGITNAEDGEHAVEAGAWALGMVFWPGSPRAVSVEAGIDLARPLRRRVELVGVFVNATLEEVVGTAEVVGLGWVQLHGDEGPSFCEAVARRAGVKVVKAARVRARADVQAIDAFRNVDGHLLDAYREGEPGGTGDTFDWGLARERRSDLPLWLAGGLVPENVARGIEQTSPWAVDVSSGVEASPGVKDHDKVEAFVAAVRATADDEAELEVEA
ncbi:MAG: phosphoribosylanthranilate isomerase [Solirubrobacterales bacterium]|jgi:phosphoribosylanthranilate isomerase|nr:phosphoribosylanthranilate isomerase [Solirubrobacterales bacterium]